jgi:phosphoribosylformylglycinamidine synthase
VRVAEALALYPRLAEAIAQGWIRSSHTPTLGGLAVAVARAALAGERGAEIELRDLPVEGALSDDARLFSESHSRFVVTCAPAHLDELLRHFEGQAIARIGTVNDTQRLVLRGQRGRSLVEVPLRALRRAHGGTLHGF